MLQRLTATTTSIRHAGCKLHGVQARVGRPPRHVTRAKEQRFVELVAAGRTLRHAAREARLSPERALDLAGDALFWKRVQDHAQQPPGAA